MLFPELRCNHGLHGGELGPDPPLYLVRHEFNTTGTLLNENGLNIHPVLFASKLNGGLKVPKVLGLPKPRRPLVSWGKIE